LQRWGYLEPGSPRRAVYDRLAMMVTKVYLKTANARGAILEFLEKNPVDMLVLGTEGREGLPRWFQASVAESVARRSRTMTLFVPSGSKGFVSLESGQISLKKVLIPVDLKPDPRPALTYAMRTAVFSGEELIEIHLLHIGSQATAPVLDCEERDYLSWKTMHREGEPVAEILKAANELEVNLIVMATAGHQGVLDALRGSVTEQVVRGAPC
ncbi:MAG: universal stress protein, partial [bacterium]|nr:universal stress protein [bacterium]